MDIIKGSGIRVIRGKDMVCKFIRMGLFMKGFGKLISTKVKADSPHSWAKYTQAHFAKASNKVKAHSILETVVNMKVTGSMANVKDTVLRLWLMGQPTQDSLRGGCDMARVLML